MLSHNVAFWLSGYINSHGESSCLYRKVFFPVTCLRIRLTFQLQGLSALSAPCFFLQVPRRHFFPPTIFLMYDSPPPPDSTTPLKHCCSPPPPPFSCHSLFSSSYPSFLFFSSACALNAATTHPPTITMQCEWAKHNEHKKWWDFMLKGQTLCLFLSKTRRSPGHR